MKFTSTIVIVLVAAFLTLAETAPAKDKAHELKNRIFLHFRKGMDLAGKFGKKYMEQADREGISEIESGRYALAAKLMYAAGSIPWVDLTFILNDDMKGEDLDVGIGTLNLHATQIQSKVDEKLESLIKLAAELPSGNGIAKDVKEYIKTLYGNINFLNALLDEVTTEQA